MFTPTTRRVSQQKKGSRQKGFLINAPDAVTSQSPSVPSTPSRSVFTVTPSDAPAPQVLVPSYRPKFDLASVVLADSHLKTILDIDSATLSDKLADYKYQGRDVLSDTCTLTPLTPDQVFKPWLRFHPSIGLFNVEAVAKRATLLSRALRSHHINAPSSRTAITSIRSPNTRFSSNCMTRSATHCAEKVFI